MGDLEKMRTRLSKRYFFELRTGNGTATPKSGPVSLRSDGRQGSKPASRRSARASLRVLDCLPRFGFCPFMGERVLPPRHQRNEIGRASCRERVEVGVVGV